MDPNHSAHGRGSRHRAHATTPGTHTIPIAFYQHTAKTLYTALKIGELHNATVHLYTVPGWWRWGNNSEHNDFMSGGATYEADEIGHYADLPQANPDIPMKEYHISRKPRPTNLIPIAEPSKEDLKLSTRRSEKIAHDRTIAWVVDGYLRDNRSNASVASASITNNIYHPVATIRLLSGDEQSVSVNSLGGGYCHKTTCIP